MEKIDALRIMKLNDVELSEKIINDAYEKLQGSIGINILNEARATLSISLLNDLKEKKNRLVEQKEANVRRTKKIIDQIAKFMEKVKELQKLQDKINNNLPNYDKAITNIDKRIADLENKNKKMVEANKARNTKERKENIINNIRGLEKNKEDIYKQLISPNTANYNDLRKQYDSIQSLISDYERELKEIEDNNSVTVEPKEEQVPLLEEKNENKEFEVSYATDEPIMMPGAEYPAIEDKSMNVEKVEEKNEEKLESTKEYGVIEDNKSLESTKEYGPFVENDNQQNVHNSVDDFDISSIEASIDREEQLRRENEILNGLSAIKFDIDNEVKPIDGQVNDINKQDANNGYFQNIGGYSLGFPQDIKEENEEQHKELSSSGISTTKSSAERISSLEFSDEENEVIKKPVGLLDKLRYKLNKKNIDKARVELTKEIRKLNYDYLRINKLKELIELENNEMQKNEYEKLINKLYVGKDFDVKYIKENLSKLENIDPDIKDELLNEIVSELPNDVNDYNVNDEIVDNLYVGSNASQDYTEDDVKSFEEMINEIDGIKNSLTGSSKLGR